MNEPYTKLFKRIVDWEYFGDAHVLQLFIYLISTANFKAEKWRGMVIKAGQKVTSIDKLANACECSKNTIQRCLKVLVESGTIELQNDNRKSIITICNYAKYQQNKEIGISKNDMQTDTQPDTLIDMQVDTQPDINIRNKEYKKEKNGNYIISENENFEPTIDGQKDIAPENLKFEKEKSCAKKEKAKKFNPFEFVKNEPAESRELLERWLSYKQAEFGKTYKTEGSFKAFIKRLNEFSGGNFETAKAIIEQSIANCYQGIFELKKQYQNGNTNNQISMQRIFEASEAMREYEQQLFSR